MITIVNQWVLTEFCSFKQCELEQSISIFPQILTSTATSKKFVTLHIGGSMRWSSRAAFWLVCCWETFAWLYTQIEPKYINSLPKFYKHCYKYDIFVLECIKRGKFSKIQFSSRLLQLQINIKRPRQQRGELRFDVRIKQLKKPLNNLFFKLFQSTISANFKTLSHKSLSQTENLKRHHVRLEIKRRQKFNKISCRIRFQSV